VTPRSVPEDHEKSALAVQAARASCGAGTRRANEDRSRPGSSPGTNRGTSSARWSMTWVMCRTAGLVNCAACDTRPVRPGRHLPPGILCPPHSSCHAPRNTSATGSAVPPGATGPRESEANRPHVKKPGGGRRARAPAPRSEGSAPMRQNSRRPRRAVSAGASARNGARRPGPTLDPESIEDRALRSVTSTNFQPWAGQGPAPIDGGWDRPPTVSYPQTLPGRTCPETGPREAFRFTVLPKDSNWPTSSTRRLFLVRFPDGIGIICQSWQARPRGLGRPSFQSG
jgi:hypothetical protein